MASARAKSCRSGDWERIQTSTPLSAPGSSGHNASKYASSGSGRAAIAIANPSLGLGHCEAVENTGIIRGNAYRGNFRTGTHHGLRRRRDEQAADGGEENAVEDGRHGKFRGIAQARKANR